MTGSRPKPCQIMIRGMLCLDTAPRQAQTFQKRDNTLWLLMTEIPRDLFSEIVIVRHPLCVCVPVNHTVTLSVRAEGTGVLNYQWFTEDEKEVCGSELFKWMTLVVVVVVFFHCPRLCCACLFWCTDVLIWALDLSEAICFNKGLTSYLK